jgi:predicted phage-related endonuclease
MKVIDVVQGSPEWLVLRTRYNTASEAPAMMNASRFQTRADLIRQKAVGGAEEVGAFKQALFDRGHATEAAARQLLENRLGEGLFPVTMVSDCNTMLASMDGQTMTGEIGYEHKLWNQALAEQVRKGELEPHYYWQLEHQLAVDLAMEKIIFVCSDGTEVNFVSMEYTRVPGRSDELLAGWKQFDEDRANFKPVEVLSAPVGTAVMALPALTVQLTGQVTKSNLAIYKKTAIAFIEAIKTDLQTDQDFADAETMVKFCDSSESELDTVKRLALAQTITIAELFDTIDNLKEAMRSKRLTLQSSIKVKKESMRTKILQEGVTAFETHWTGLNTRLGNPYMPTVPVDFVSVMKGKKTVTGWRDAMTSELARAKLEANAIADRIQINLTMLREIAKDYTFLFADRNAVVLKAADDCRALAENRIAAHKAEVERKAQLKRDEDARIAREKEEKDLREANEAQAEKDRLAALTPAPAPVEQPAAAVEPLAPDSTPLPTNVVPLGSTRPAPAPAPALTPATLKLGVINERLAPIQLTADGLRALGFEPAAKERSAVLYHERDFTHICASLINHIGKVQAQQAA